MHKFGKECSDDSLICWKRGKKNHFARYCWSHARKDMNNNKESNLSILHQNTGQLNAEVITQEEEQNQHL